MEEKLFCTRCECLIEDDDYYTVHDEIICDRCRDDYTVTCECCGELIWSDEDCGDDNTYLCESCRDENYCSCYHCDRLIHNDDSYEYDGDYYCYECYEELEKRKSIRPYESTPKKLMDKAKSTYNRYVAVNLCPHDTIEFRLFRGTLKLNTLYATIQLVNHICETALFLCDSEIQSLSWSDFVAKIKEPELIRYLKERRLYINEEITNEEDI